MAIQEVRLGNLDKLIRERFEGIDRRFAAAVGMSDQLLNRYRKQKINLGEKKCRELESILKLADGYMDHVPEAVELDEVSKKLSPMVETVQIRPVLDRDQIIPYLNEDNDVAIKRAFAMGPGTSTKAFFFYVLSSDVTEIARPGDLVAVDPDEKWAPGSYVMATLNDLPPTLYKITLGPSGNTMFVVDGQRIEPEAFSIIGKVLFSVRFA